MAGPRPHRWQANVARIEQARAERLLTMRQLASEAGLSRHTIQSLVGRRRQRVSLLTLQRVARALDLDYGDVIIWK